jgi:hypothetical protein
VTESLTTDLSRISGSFVIGRNTAFTYKGKHVDLKQIGRELNVRYVLEGSVQRSGSRLRVAVQLIDAESGAHLSRCRLARSNGGGCSLRSASITLASTLSGRRRRPMKSLPPSAAQTGRTVFPYPAFMKELSRSEAKVLVRRG